jgi:hypothetical protein
MRKPAHERFKAGDIIRYASGVSALFRWDGVHNQGMLYGTHVMGGAHGASDHMFFDLQPASPEDIEFCKGRHPDWFSDARPAANDDSAAQIHWARSKLSSRQNLLFIFRNGIKIAECWNCETADLLVTALRGQEGER